MIVLSPNIAKNPQHPPSPPYLPYPLHDMHGRVNAGIATFSKFKIISSTRYSLTVTDSLSKLFDLDRCFVANEFDTSKCDRICGVVNDILEKFGDVDNVEQES